MTIKIQFYPIHKDTKIPEPHSPGSVGLDVYSYCPNSIFLDIGEIQLIPTGFRLVIPEGYSVEIRPRSGFSTKNKILIPNSPGTIDSDYRGEIFIPLFNLSKSIFEVEHNTRIAQLLLRKNETFQWEMISEMPEDTLRGTKGFGSTGIN
jgi:dUTP pyrophosphatase